MEEQQCWQIIPDCDVPAVLANKDWKVQTFGLGDNNIALLGYNVYDCVVMLKAP